MSHNFTSPLHMTMENAGTSIIHTPPLSLPTYLSTYLRTYECDRFDGLVVRATSAYALSVYCRYDSG